MDAFGRDWRFGVMQPNLVAFGEVRFGQLWLDLAVGQPLAPFLKKQNRGTRSNKGPLDLGACKGEGGG